MTDAEIVKACAEALGHTVLTIKHYGGEPAAIIGEEWRTKHDIVWFPEEHALEMIEIFHLEIHPPITGVPSWHVYTKDGKHDAADKSLRKAVYLCVAKLKERP